MLDFLRGFQRPWVVYLSAIAFVGLVVYLALRWGNLAMAEKMVDTFTGALLVIIGWLFGERGTKKTNGG